jgi:phytoene/squalene synthetase
LSFDDGYRVDSFTSGEDLEAFESAVEGVAARAKQEVLHFRQRFAALPQSQSI